MQKRIVLLFLLIVCGDCYAFSGNDSIVKNALVKLKNYNLQIATENIENDTLKKLIEFQLNYSKQGIISDSLILKNNLENLKNKTGIIANYVYGDYLTNSNKNNDSLAFYRYRFALKLAKKENDTLLINECINRICDKLFYNGKDLNLYRNYIVEYELYAKDSIDLFWVNYYQTTYKLLKHLEKTKEKNTINFESLNFNKGFILSKESAYFLGVMHQLKGIYFDVFTTNYIEAENEFKKAIFNYKKNQFFFAQKEIYGNTINASIAIFNQGRTEESILGFKEALSLKEHVYSDKNKMDIYNWLNKAYKKNNKIDSAYLYAEKSLILKEKIDKYNHSIAIKKIDEKSMVKEKDEQLNTLNVKNNYLQKQLVTILPVLGIITIILILTFYLYKRYKNKSEVLEEEKSETLQKLDELKNIVIKNHIILKDRSKVYIADLLYIKSDDHYLNIFLNEGKNHFVRGKLSTIKAELPPNFIQCHRSYIVNSNFIKQINSNTLILIDKTEIPLSRSYKDKF